MHRYPLIPILGMLLLASCMASVGPHGAQVAIAPPLPPLVELATPYYAHAGYRYYYNANRWYYAPSKNERWIVLPKDRWPREVRFHGGGWRRGRP